MKHGIGSMLGVLPLAACMSANALVLRDVYPMPKEAVAIYLGGLYDGMLVAPVTEQKRTQCVEALGYVGLVKEFNDFVRSLPEDSGSPERRTYDGMPAAAVALLIIDKACVRAQPGNR